MKTESSPSRSRTWVIAGSSAPPPSIPKGIAGADEVYYYYDEAGVGFAEHVGERVFSAPEGIKPAVKDMPAI